MAIGDTIESRRLGLGWTQVELAQRAGVDPRQIRRYESGEAQPSIAVAQGIAKALRITLDELAGHARTLVAGYKIPREFYVLTELPKSMLGKVLRKQVREQLDALTPLP